MVIDASLKLVIERRRESDGATFHVFAEPVSRDTAREFWSVIQAAVSKLYLGGGNPVIAPRFAANAVREAAREAGVEDRVERFFLAEIRRRVMVAVPGDAGWDTMTFDEAAKSAMTEDEAEEIESAIVFFTLAWRFHSTADRKAVISGAVSLWQGRIISSGFTEWIASLPTSTATDASGATTAAA
ncbi:MAG: hypothetical protein N2444_00055 [Methylocystis sp.]|nr:hypothetical protein [Methylocystis sp.]